MICKVPYTELGGRYRPYLEVVFSNLALLKSSSRTLGMVDSGADHTVIPFSIGRAIGLADPTEPEKLASVSGVGGDLSYIERPCRIYVADRKQNVVYGFNETVWWIYPDPETQKQQDIFVKQYQELRSFREQSIPGTKLHLHFEKQMQQTINELKKIGNRLETDVLLGRPFFDNFYFIQFCHKDRNRENLCFFNYKIIPGKMFETLPIMQVSSPPVV
ncbi:MAG: hypothetical protein HYT27_02145 [Parcubacteria group bacterium]|nr:hypothetical protein [Parcubacteria group bacterium]